MKNLKAYFAPHPPLIISAIGKGEEKRALEEKAQRLNISSHVIFLGMKKNIKAWYSAFDVFVFPSHFEGLGIVLLEAQANGVPILATKGTIPTDVKVNDNLEFISLSDSPDRKSVV